QAVCPLRLDYPSNEDGADCVRQASRPPRGPAQAPHIRLSRIYALLDDITPGVLGDQTSDSQKASPPHAEGVVAVVSRQSARALETPASDALPEVARA